MQFKTLGVTEEGRCERCGTRPEQVEFFASQGFVPVSEPVQEVL